jgi:hypothetical protein
VAWVSDGSEVAAVSVADPKVMSPSVLALMSWLREVVKRDIRPFRGRSWNQRQALAGA